MNLSKFGFNRSKIGVIQREILLLFYVLLIKFHPDQRDRLESTLIDPELH